MRFELVTLFPEMYRAISEYGVTGRAVKSGVLDLNCWNPRDFTTDKHRTVDDRPYGGGPGMLMKVEPLRDAIYAAKNAAGADAKVIYLSPQGRRFDQRAARKMATQGSLILVAGRYEGIDERLMEAMIDEEWSIGDYVLSGGELASMVMVDAIARLLPGVLGHEDSADQDSFESGLLDCPHYTRPEELDGQAVPQVLLSGDHQRIERWRLQQRLGRTWSRRPDLLEKLELSENQQQLLDEYVRESR